MLVTVSCEEETNTKRVLITGFGPFFEIKQNPSWEGVNSINKEELEERCNINLIREKVKVEYDYVDQCVPEMWEKYQPDLTIHVGVDAKDQQTFLIETKAQKGSYENIDAAGQLPENNQNRSAGPESIVTDLDVSTMCAEFNFEPPADGLRAEASSDAGRYLCEYIYYTSLCRSRSKTLFVHVPPTHSTHLIAKGLERIIDICIGQLRNKEIEDCNEANLRGTEYFITS